MNTVLRHVPLEMAAPFGPGIGDLDQQVFDNLVLCSGAIPDP